MPAFDPYQLFQPGVGYDWVSTSRPRYMWRGRVPMQGATPFLGQPGVALGPQASRMYGGLRQDPYVRDVAQGLYGSAPVQSNVYLPLAPMRTVYQTPVVPGATAALPAPPASAMNTATAPGAAAPTSGPQFMYIPGIGTFQVPEANMSYANPLMDPSTSPYGVFVSPLAGAVFNQSQQEQQASGAGAGGGVAKKPKYAPPPEGLAPGLYNWWNQFQDKHGGQTPVEYYEEEGAGWQYDKNGEFVELSPLQEAMSDLEWSQSFQAMTGHAPSDYDWTWHWYETHGGYPYSEAELYVMREKAKKKAKKQAKREAEEKAKKEGPEKPTPYTPPPVYWRP